MIVSFQTIDKLSGEKTLLDINLNFYSILHINKILNLYFFALNIFYIQNIYNFESCFEKLESYYFYF